MKYRWKGPATSIEVWSPDYSESQFAGFINTGDTIPVDLDEGSSQVTGWLAFNLIEPVEAGLTAIETDKPAKGGKSGKDNG